MFGEKISIIHNKGMDVISGNKVREHTFYSYLKTLIIQYCTVPRIQAKLDVISCLDYIIGHELPI